MWHDLGVQDDMRAADDRLQTRRGRRAFVAQTTSGVWLSYLGGALWVSNRRAEAACANDMDRLSKALGGTQTLRAPMAGRIVAHHAVVGSHYQKGQILVILEAMKMEYPICAPAAGHVRAHHGAVGEAVGLDTVLVTFVCAPGG